MLEATTTKTKRTATKENKHILPQAEHTSMFRLCYLQYNIFFYQNFPSIVLNTNRIKIRRVSIFYRFTVEFLVGKRSPKSNFPCLVNLLLPPAWDVLTVLVNFPSFALSSLFRSSASEWEKSHV